jgi:RNA polymerase subunit RPABC4/transcription elongation factor Spt4
MHWLRSQLPWIPRPAWIVASMVGLVPLIGLIGFAVIAWQAPGGGPATSLGWIVVPFVILAPLAFLYVLLIGYVYGDARRRGMRQVLWTLLAIFVPNGIGILIYFLLRQPPQVSCPRCQAQLQPGLSFCPNCGSPMGPACPQCHRLTEAGWSHCGHCGAPLPASSLPVPGL